ncbi:MAG TPA: hypothetical protein PKZ69_09140, partial [Candidatus Cloacimonadota bacterium]|nr:hypothetical protein [Candidatus Cloacimonadota bacterium]
MPTTSGFRDDYFSKQLSLVGTDRLHFVSQFSAFSIIQVCKSELCINQHHHKWWVMEDLNF